MIITHAKHGIRLHARLETLTKNPPFVELTPISGGFAMCRTIEMSLEQTRELIITLQRLVCVQDKVEKTLSVISIEDLHVRAEQLIRDAGQEHMLSPVPNDIQLVVDEWTRIEGGVTDR